MLPILQRISSGRNSESARIAELNAILGSNLRKRPSICQEDRQKVIALALELSKRKSAGLLPERSLRQIAVGLSYIDMPQEKRAALLSLFQKAGISEQSILSLKSSLCNFFTQLDKGEFQRVCEHWEDFSENNRRAHFEDFCSRLSLSLGVRDPYFSFKILKENILGKYKNNVISYGRKSLSSFNQANETGSHETLHHYFEQSGPYQYQNELIFASHGWALYTTENREYYYSQPAEVAVFSGEAVITGMLLYVLKNFPVEDAFDRAYDVVIRQQKHNGRISIRRENGRILPAPKPEEIGRQPAKKRFALRMQ